MSKEDYTDILETEGIDSQGYGRIPKMVTRDRRLSPEAKCIYGYFCSFAGAGKTAFPKVKTIIYDLVMGKDRYYKHFKLLIKYGYIKVRQIKDENGRFNHNIYKLCTEIPVYPVDPENLPSPENKESEPSPENRDTVNPTPVTKDSNNNNTKSNNSINNNLFNIQNRKRKPKQEKKEKYEDFYL